MPRAVIARDPGITAWPTFNDVIPPAEGRELVKYENRHVGSLNLFILLFRVSGGINRLGQTYGGGGVDAQPFGKGTTRSLDLFRSRLPT